VSKKEYKVEYNGFGWAVRNPDGTLTPSFGEGDKGYKAAQKHANTMNRNAAK
jgi:hypothetical protein